MYALWNEWRHACGFAVKRDGDTIVRSVKYHIAQFQSTISIVIEVRYRFRNSLMGTCWRAHNIKKACNPASVCCRDFQCLCLQTRKRHWKSVSSRHSLESPGRGSYAAAAGKWGNRRRRHFKTIATLAG